MNRFTALAKAFSFAGVLCGLSVMAVSCENESSDLAESETAQTPSLPAQVLEKTVTTSVNADGLGTLVVSVPHYITTLDIKTAAQEDVSINFNLIADSEKKLESVSESILTRTELEDKLVISMPESEDCEIFLENDVLRHLRNMCARSVTVTLPAGKNIEVYDADSGTDPSTFSSVAMVWPGTVPGSVEDLMLAMSKIRKDEYRLTTLQRFTDAGSVNKLTVAEAEALVSMVFFKAERFEGLKLLAEPLKASYGSAGVPKDEFASVLDLLEDTHRAEATALVL